MAGDQPGSGATRLSARVEIRLLNESLLRNCSHVVGWVGGSAACWPTAAAAQPATKNQIMSLRIRIGNLPWHHLTHKWFLINTQNIPTDKCSQNTFCFQRPVTTAAESWPRMAAPPLGKCSTKSASDVMDARSDLTASSSPRMTMHTALNVLRLGKVLWAHKSCVLKIISL